MQSHAPAPGVLGAAPVLWTQAVLTKSAHSLLLEMHSMVTSTWASRSPPAKAGEGVFT